MLAVGLSPIAFIMLRYVPTVPTLSLHHEWVLNFVKYFLCIYRDDHVIFILHFIHMLCHINLLIFSSPCIPGLNLIWSWSKIFLIYYWIHFANIFEDFCNYIYQGYWLVIFLFVVLLYGFGIRLMVTSENWKCFLLFIFWGRVWEG